MTTLPTEITAHLEQVRSAYLAHYKQVVDEAIADEQSARVIAEAAIGAENEPAQMRLDVVVENKDGSFARQFVAAPSAHHWQHSEHAVGTAKLLVDDTVWFAFTLIVQPVPPDGLAFAQTWFRKWFEQGAAVEPPFAGHVHFIDVEAHADGYRIDVDLGSAPVAAVDELVAQCVAHGAERVWLMSGADALAARIEVEDVEREVDDDDDDGMFELPDELLEHLAEVREDYLDAYVAKLRTIEGRVAIEAGAGRTQGELAIRVDILEVDDAGTMTPSEVTATRVVPWDEGHYDLRELRLYVMPLVWPSLVVVAWPAPPDTTFITTWYRRWLEQGFEVDKPFGGYVHMLSDIRSVEDRISFLVDLGTAPVEAVRDLIEQLVAHGVTTVSMGSGEHALSGTPTSGVV